MKKSRSISILVMCLVSFNVLLAQTKLTISSSFYSKIKADTINIKIESTGNLENQLNDSLLFFEIRTKERERVSGVMKLNKNVKKNRIYVYIPVNQNWYLNNKRCFNISLLFIYDPKKNIIEDASCDKPIVISRNPRLNIGQGLLEILAYMTDSYFY